MRHYLIRRIAPGSPIVVGEIAGELTAEYVRGELEVLGAQEVRQDPELAAAALRWHAGGDQLIEEHDAAELLQADVDEALTDVEGGPRSISSALRLAHERAASTGEPLADVWTELGHRLDRGEVA